MKVQNTPYNYNLSIKPTFLTQPSFKAGLPVETIKHCNIGMMRNGLIGKIQVPKADGKEVFLNIFKYANSVSELYFVKDDAEQVIGEIELKVKKALNYDKAEFAQDPSHVFVETLRNYSNPRTPYYKEGLEEYKGIGTRLLQIAQRRSDESLCNGNIELISKNESFNFYRKLGFESVGNFWGCNPNKMYLPPSAKEPLSKLNGGL